MSKKQISKKAQAISSNPMLSSSFFSFQREKKIKTKAKIQNGRIEIPNTTWNINPILEGWCCWQELSHLFYDKMDIASNEKMKILKQIIKDYPDIAKKAATFLFMAKQYAINERR